MNERTRTRRIAQEAARQFGLVEPRVRLLHDGYNVTYRVDVAGERYALRVGLIGATLAAAQAEIAWVGALAQDTELRLASPVGCLEVQGRVCVLNRWLTGVQRGRGLTPNMLLAVGRVMATLHDHGESWTPRDTAGWTRPTLRDVWLDRPSPMPLLPPAAQPIFARAEARLVPLLDRLMDEECFVLHADLHQGNYRFDPGHDVGVLDFDDTSIGHPAQDVAICHYYIQHLPNHDALFDALRRGYTERRRWPTDPETDRALLIWRALGLCASLCAHPSASIKGLGSRLLPRWTARTRAWLES